MHSQTNAEKNRTADVTPAVKPVAPWRVTEATALPEFQLHVRFTDGTEGVVLMDQLIHAEDAGVFAALKDADVFRQVRVELGVVTWPGGQDLAPDAMHDAIREHGNWKPV